jgi:hypothetical protein
MNSTRILAKIETRQALLNFQGILAEADGIIVSRGEADWLACVKTDVGVQACKQLLLWMHYPLYTGCSCDDFPCIVLLGGYADSENECMSE